MIVRYLPGRLDERIPVPVQRKIVSHGREGADREKLVFETADGKRQEVSLDHCAPLMSNRKRIAMWLKMAGLVVLLVAFCAGGYGIALEALSQGPPGLVVIKVLQLIVSGGLVLYVSVSFKAAVERCLYGGLSFELGDIYFQSDDERAMFEDILRKEERR